MRRPFGFSGAAYSTSARSFLTPLEIGMGAARRSYNIAASGSLRRFSRRGRQPQHARSAISIRQERRGPPAIFKASSYCRRLQGQSVHGGSSAGSSRPVVYLQGAVADTAAKRIDSSPIVREAVGAMPLGRIVKCDRPTDLRLVLLRWAGL